MITKVKRLFLHKNIVFVYGIKRAKNLEKKLSRQVRIVGYIDRDYAKYQSGFEGKRVIPVERIINEKFDYIYISSVKHAHEMLDELKKLGIPCSKIIYPIDKKYGKFEVINNSDMDKYCLRYSNGKVCFDALSESDLRCYEEIFRDESYKIDMPVGNTVFIDFGMNIGAAALYFSQFDVVKKIYGFEPFPDTFNNASHNISLNDEIIKNKFEIYDFAVSNCEDTEEIAIYSDHTRSRSIVGSSINLERNPLRTVVIKKKEAKVILNEILNKEIGKKVILKIDVEGSEYGIFDNIKNTDILDKIDWIIMEYHRGIMPLLSEIDSRGFKYMLKGTDAMGFIFAHK